MKTIGLLGGMSWESTISYYQVLNRGVARALGGLHSARIAMVSIDFSELEAMQRADDWAGAAQLMIDAAQRVERAGADFLLIGANTMHLVADEVAQAVGIPLLHIAEATGREMQRHGITQAGLLGTRFTMEKPFYREYLASRFGIDTLLPDEPGRDRVHGIIYEELCRGIFREESAAVYLRQIERLAEAGAQGVIFGCTEIGLLLGGRSLPLPAFDTAQLHAELAVDWALDQAA